MWCGETEIKLEEIEELRFSRLFNGLIRLLTGFLFLSLTQCAAQSQLVEGEENTIVSETLRYYLYYPVTYQEYDDEQFPLLLFLHGGGESGQELEILKKNGPPKLLAEGKQFPFLVLAPQHPHPKKWWNIRAVMELLETVVEENRVDTNRIYLTGLSRGGSAAWELAVQYPDTFAAMMVVCGMTPVPYAHWINKEMPIWVFHGAMDNVIPIEHSEKMVAKLQEMGYPVRFTRYEDVAHNAWERAYTTEEVYSWFMTHSKDDGKK